MAGFWPGLIFFLLAMAAGYIDDMLLKLPTPVARIGAAAAFLASAGCLVLGGYHALYDWGFVDLLSMTPTEGVSVAGKRALALGLVMIWPFVMILIGLVGALKNAHTLRSLSSRP